MGDGISDAYYAAERDAASSRTGGVEADRPRRLTPSERISYDVFQWQRTRELRGLQPDLLALTVVRPIDHFGSIHTASPNSTAATARRRSRPSRIMTTG